MLRGLLFAFIVTALALGILGMGAAYLLLTPPPQKTDSMFTLSSSAFQDTDSIPVKYTCDVSAPVSPPLSISNAPEGTKSFVLIADDPDVPKQLLPSGVFDHWVLYNIPAETVSIPEGGSAGNPGLNGAGKDAYAAPCPPPQFEPSEHRYIFTLYAVDTTIEFFKEPTRADVEGAIQGHILDTAVLEGKYKRQTN